MKKETNTPISVKNRYSKEELQNEFKPNVLKKLAKAQVALKMLNEAHRPNEHGTDDTSPTYKNLEEGYQVFSKEENSKLAARQEKFIKSLENALIRIENGTYGICRVTGELICKGRLKSVPHATTTCVAKEAEKKEKRKAVGRFDFEEE